MTESTPIDPSDLTPVPGQETLRVPSGLPSPPAEGTVRLDSGAMAEALATGPAPDQTLQLKTGPLPPPPPHESVSVAPSPYATHEMPPAVPRSRKGLWLGLIAAVLVAGGLGTLALLRPDLLGLGGSEADAPVESETLPQADAAGTPDLPAPIPEVEVPPALRSYHEKALKGDANAMAVLGTMYYNGLNVPMDRAEGLKWLRRAADQGNAAAKKQLSQMEGR